MITTKALVFVLLLFSLLDSLSVVDGQEYRVWRDQTGVHETTATLDGIKIVLRQSDGELAEVRLDLLSAEDQQYIIQFLHNDLLHSARDSVSAANTLCDQILSSYRTDRAESNRKSKIAILDLRGVDGSEKLDGRKLAEQLITQLHETGEFSIQERSLLAEIMEEHKLAADGFVDPKSAKKIGELLGVDEVLTGTICEKDGLRRINIRLVSTKSGMISAVASVGNSPLGNLADQTAKSIIESLTKSGNINLETIGVVGFVGLDVNANPYSEVLSEDLVSTLFDVGFPKNISVAERQLLSQVLREHQLNGSGLIDERTAQKLGQFLAVDGVVTGSLTRKGDLINVNARIISVEQGTVLAATDQSVSIQRSASLQRSLAGGFFLREDFSDLKPGALPEGWSSDSAIVQSYRGAHVFGTNENRRDHLITIEGIEFPNDFSISISLITSSRDPDMSGLGNINYQIRIGECHVKLRVEDNLHPKRAKLMLNKSEREIDFNEVHAKKVKLTLEKEGVIFRLFLNDREIVVDRIEEFRHPKGISIQADGKSSTKWAFAIDKIEGKGLETKN